MSEMQVVQPIKDGRQSYYAATFVSTGESKLS